MPRSSDKKHAHNKEEASKTRSKRPRQDLPDPGSIIKEVPFTSPKGNTYRIIVTNEKDPYEEPESHPKEPDK